MFVQFLYGNTESGRSLTDGSGSGTAVVTSASSSSSLLISIGGAAGAAAAGAAGAAELTLSYTERAGSVRVDSGEDSRSLGAGEDGGSSSVGAGEPLIENSWNQEEA